MFLIIHDYTYNQLNYHNGNNFSCTVALNIITLLNNQYIIVCLYDQVWMFR